MNVTERNDNLDQAMSKAANLWQILSFLSFPLPLHDSSIKFATDRFSLQFDSNIASNLPQIFVPSSLSRKCSKAARTAAWESVWLVPVRPSTDLNMSGLVIGIFVPIWKCQNWSMVSLYWFEYVRIGNWCLWTYCNKILLILFKRKMASKGVSIDKSIRHRWSLDLHVLWI